MAPCGCDQIQQFDDGGSVDSNQPMMFDDIQPAEPPRPGPNELDPEGIQEMDQYGLGPDDETLYAKYGYVPPLDPQQFQQKYGYAPTYGDPNHPEDAYGRPIQPAQPGQSQGPQGPQPGPIGAAIAGAAPAAAPITAAIAAGARTMAAIPNPWIGVPAGLVAGFIASGVVGKIQDWLRQRYGPSTGPLSKQYEAAAAEQQPLAYQVGRVAPIAAGMTTGAGVSALVRAVSAALLGGVDVVQQAIKKGFGNINGDEAVSKPALVLLLRSSPSMGWRCADLIWHNQVARTPRWQALLLRIN